MLISRAMRATSFSFLICLLPLMVARPVTSAATPAVKEPASDQMNLPPAMGWEDWQVVRDQHAPRATVKVLVRKGEAPATAKVRVVLAQTPKPTFDSPQAVVNALVHTANQQCQKAIATTLSKTAENVIFEMRGIGCPGQKGERYLLQRIAYIGPWELQVTYAPMDPADNLSSAEKQRALKLISSVTITQAKN